MSAGESEKHWLGVIPGALFVALVGTLPRIPELHERTQSAPMTACFTVLSFAAELGFYLLFGLGILSPLANAVRRRGRLALSSYLKAGIPAGIAWSVFPVLIQLMTSGGPCGGSCIELRSYLPVLAMNALAGASQMTVIWYKRVLVR